MLVDLPNSWLSTVIRLNKLSPLLHYLSITSSLLQLSPSLLSHVILTCRMVFQLTRTIATSLVPYKSPVEVLPALPRMLCNQKSERPLHFVTDTNVTICFQH